MNTKLMLSVLSFAAVTLTGVCAPAAVEAKAPAPAPAQWQGRKVAMLGDSITDPRQGHRIYWQYLTSWLGWESKCYGVSGQAWKHIPAQAAKMEKERKRLGDLEVGNSGRLVDSLEVMVWYFLKGPPSAEKQQVREVFEKTAGRPVRDHEKILADRWEFGKKQDEAARKMMRAFIRSSLEKKQSGK